MITATQMYYGFQEHKQENKNKNTLEPPLKISKFHSSMSALWRYTKDKSYENFSAGKTCN